jgi:drug/metabolite transporter (DMT)-like permease
MTAAPRFDWFRLAPIAFVCVWSGGFTALIVAFRGMEPWTLLAIRYAICVAVLAPLALLLRPAMPRGRGLLHLAVNALIVQTAYFVLMVYALRLGMSAGAAALVIGLQPVLVALLVPYVAGERVPPVVWLGLLLGLVGTALVVTSRGAIVAEGWGGIASAVGALLTMAAGVLYEKRFGRPHHPVAANLVIYAVAGLACLPFAWFLEGLEVTWSGPVVLAMAYLVFGNSLLSMTLLFAMVRRGEAARVSALFFLVPPVAALIAMVLVDEQLTAIAWAGMALAATGVAIAARAR